MHFKKLKITNFRNFENVEIDINNRNIIFGLNDIGKTNFLQAIRFLLDKDIRKNGFIKSDFHKNNIENDIEIMLELDISDFDESEDTRKLISIIDGADVRHSDNADIFFIKLIGKFDEIEMIGNVKLFWGDKIDSLKEIQGTLYSSRIDNIFKVVYIDPSVDLDKVFEKNRRILTNEFENSEVDKKIIQNINRLTEEVNSQIGNMSKIKELEKSLTDEYTGIKKEDIEIQMKSEMAIKGFFSDITPYIKRPGDEQHYPTSGDGRKKLLIYSLVNLINKRKFSNKIIIYLIEEPENSLHRSTQIGISKQIFGQSYPYSFISTHSPDIIYSANNVQFIRIYSEDKLECRSYLYNIQADMKLYKKRLDRQICNAIFCKKVLLVEGPSEYLLFERVMSEINYDYEADGGYILCVHGIYFDEYFKVFKGLGIDVIVKTDNDIQKKILKVEEGKDEKSYNLLGINRCKKLIDEKFTPEDDIKLPKKVLEKKKKEARLKIFNEKKGLVDKFKENKIFLSELDLENDLASVIPSKMMEVTKKKDIEKAITKLQAKKRYHMVDLVESLSEEDCRAIYEHKNFECLKELNNDR